MNVAFHGRTSLALALTSQTHPYKAGLGPFSPEVYRVPFNDLAAFDRAWRTLVAPEDVAAIVFEPVQGEGGFIPATPEFAQGLRRICDEHGIVLVCDEVQSGFARTGRFFAIEHSGVEPDLITIAKSIAMGLPLSGVLGKAEVMDSAHDGAVGRRVDEGDVDLGQTAQVDGVEMGGHIAPEGRQVGDDRGLRRRLRPAGDEGGRHKDRRDESGGQPRADDHERFPCSAPQPDSARGGWQ